MTKLNTHEYLDDLFHQRS